MVNLTIRQIIPDYTEDEEGNININVAMMEGDEFGAAAMAIDMAGLAQIEESGGDITVPELFAGTNAIFFDVLAGMQEEGQEGIWWEWFVYFFTYIHESGHTEALSYFMWQSMGDEVSEWMNANSDSMNAFFSWIDNL